MTRETDADLAFQLLADWWMNTVQALVDSAGHDGAIARLRPHHVNAATAAACLLRDQMGLKVSNPASGIFASKIALHFMHRKDDVKGFLYQKGTVVDVLDCPFKHGPREICDTLCEINPRAFTNVFSSGYSIRLVTRMHDGDLVCRWISTPLPREPPSDLLGMGEPTATVLSVEWPQEIVDNFAIQYLGEFWAIATRALIDHAGSDGAAAITRPYMEHSGISYGLRSRQLPQNQAKDKLAMITDCITSCEMALQMKLGAGKVRATNADRIIEECPFRDAPPEVCAQFESFCNGICQAIGPEFEFHYDRRMTDGGSDCHWLVRLKEDAKQINAETCHETPSPNQSDPLVVLSIRLASGEISEEEYERKAALIKKSLGR